MAHYDSDKKDDIVRQAEVDHELELGDKRHAKVLDLGAQAGYENFEYTEAESKAVLRKIDWRLCPMLIWICAWPNKINTWV